MNRNNIYFVEKVFIGAGKSGDSTTKLPQTKDNEDKRHQTELSLFYDAALWFRFGSLSDGGRVRLCFDSGQNLFDRVQDLYGFVESRCFKKVRCVVDVGRGEY